MNDIMEFTDGEGGSLVVEKNTEGGFSIYGNAQLRSQEDVVLFAAWLRSAADKMISEKPDFAGVDKTVLTFASKNPMEE